MIYDDDYAKLGTLRTSPVAGNNRYHWLRFEYFSATFEYQRLQLFMGLVGYYGQLDN